MLHIYWGFGRGKTSTLNGSAIRAHGAGLKVLIVRFLKGRPTNEDAPLKKIGINLHSFHYQQKFVFQMDEHEFAQTKIKVKEGFDFLIANKGKYDLIVLDEAVDLVHTKLVTEDQLIDLAKTLQEKSEVMMSGHYELPRLFKIADLVTHYQSQKHYFDKGKMKSRLGIEF